MSDNLLGIIVVIGCHGAGSDLFLNIGLVGDGVVVDILAKQSEEKLAIIGEEITGSVL